VVVKPPIRFSALKIDFPTLQVGENSNHLLTIKNYSPKCYVCEIFLPYYKVCGLKISPLVFRLQKGKSIEISVEFNSFFKKLTPFTLDDIREEQERDPAVNYELRKKMLLEEQASNRPKEEEDPKNKKKGQAVAPKPPGERKKTKKEQDEEEAQRLRDEEARKLAQAEEEQRRLALLEQYDHDSELLRLGGKMQEFEVDGFQSQHYSWLVPCFFKPVDEPETSRSAIYLEVNTVSTTKILVADRTEIGFGEIAVGLKKVEELLITNLGSSPAVLQMDLLPLFGGFNVLNALKAIPPGKTRSVVIQFEPHTEQEFKETLRIYSGQSSISIKLKGTSVNPEVAITPDDGLLQVGAALPGDRVEKTFEIKNVSNFPVEFTLQTLHSGIKRTDGQEAFLYFPSKGLIDSRQAFQVKVVFYPDRVSEKYCNLVKIDVPNQKNEKNIFIKGACYPRQGYISHFKPLEFPKKDELEEVSEHPLDFLKVKDSSRIIGCEMKQMLLTFPKTLETVAKNSPLLERKITVGSFKLADPKLEKVVNYDFNLVVSLA
jgi:hypothetical protein